LRSAISLQNPTLCPSIIVRVVESNFTNAVATSCVVRAFASVDGMGQGPHRNWSIVGRHAAKFSACYEHGARTEVRSTDGGVCTRRSSADNDHVHLI
jgi:hypothetical protein